MFLETIDESELAAALYKLSQSNAPNRERDQVTASEITGLGSQYPKPRQRTANLEPPTPQI